MCLAARIAQNYSSLHPVGQQIAFNVQPDPSGIPQITDNAEHNLGSVPSASK